ncbi:MAG: DNA helicase PcrA [Clostridia bacterium]|nr:DNA helicase PcrA [Clostridia bacterium]MDD4386155.1 DNA helicase PcrA [Clostridia bacterium]
MSKFLEGLNKNQLEAVSYTEGPLLILAGAGSGKTRVLTFKIAYLIEQGIVKPWQILAITFTNKAAKEMKARALSLIDEASDVWLGTFHSVCVKILKREIEILGYGKDFNIFDELDKEKLIKEVLKKMNLDDKKFIPSSMGYEISKSKNGLILPEQYSKEAEGDYRKEQIAKIYTMYQNELKSYNSIDFDDIIMLTVKLFIENPDRLSYYQNKFKYVLVDEYQDTNKLQFTFISLIASAHGNVCVVGDESQSIYGWRGADISNILNFEKEFFGAKIIKLEENYRSTQTILNAANEVIKNNSAKIDKNLWTKNLVGDKIKYFNANNEYAEVEYVVQQIDDICRKEKKNYSNFAVLFRTNAQARVIEDVFMKTGTPYKLIGGLKFYSRKEVKDLTSYLKLLQNVNDAIALKRIINVPKRGIGDSALDKLGEIAIQKNISLFEVIKDSNNYRDIRSSGNIMLFRDIILQLQSIKDELSVSELMKKILKVTGYEAMLNEENSKEAENRFDNLMEYIGVATEFEKESADNTLADFLDSIALVSDVDKLEEGAEAVTLMTMHSAKGLEFDVVFLVGMEEGLFPSSRSINEDEKAEEERRLCYVGITRAKEKVYVTSSSKRTMYGSTSYTIPSRFISEIPEHLFEEEVSPKVVRNNEFLNAEYARSSAVKTTNVIGEIFKSSKKSIGLSVDSFLGNITNKVDETKDISKYSIGNKIKHKKFGIGVICNMEPEGDDIKLEINFETSGFKRLMAKYTPLEIID